jgi:predicted alpha-1,2-mannosidase
MLTVVLDTYVKGLMNSDMETAYRGMRKEIMVQMPDKFEAIGYIPARPDQTCELSYDNWCVAQMAQLLNKKDDFLKFIKRASFYRNTWDNDLGFFRARAASGEWLDFPENPNINREKYSYEGTPWQWRWFVPHDVPDLIDLIGGRNKFIADLDYFFTNDLYQAGNQPDIHAPFLFNYAAAPWLTQKWVSKILTQPMTQLYGTHDFFEEPIHDRIYKATPDGYLREMDDDYGCMAAWYVMSAVGLYQVCLGKPIYQLSGPIFEKVSINLDTRYYPGREFIIEARDMSQDNIYIQSAVLNGNSYNNSWISHSDIVKGGELIFRMGPQPNKTWGIAIE